MDCNECTRMLRTDALPNKEIEQIVSPSRRAISARVWEQVEQELDEYEKISILFLIAAEYSETYEKILLLCKNIEERPNIIASFLENNIPAWEEKLLEALCIINNREILKNLGFNPCDIAMKYHQDIHIYTAKINTPAKVLYKLFETMNRKKAKSLLHCIYEEDRIQRELEDNYYLELHALYWMHVKYITVSPDGRGDLSNILKHLKKLGYYNKPIYHDVEHFSTTSTQSDSRSTGKSLPNGCRKDLENTIRPTNETTDKRTIKKGKCVIVNEVNFPPESEYDKREGSDRDRDELRRIFTGMDFDVEAHDNLTRQEIMSTLAKVSDDFNNETHDCLVISILTHGTEGGIISSDGIEIPIKVIENAVCTWHLRDVLKILIIQACQGKIMGSVSEKSIQTPLTFDGPTENIRRLANFAMFMSTIKGYKSIRHKRDGTWFIQAVCQVLSQPKSFSIFDWSIEVTKIVRDKIGHINNSLLVSQIPELTYRLDASYYFPPYDEKVAVNA